MVDKGSPPTRDSSRHPYRPLFILDEPKAPREPSFGFVIGFSIFMLILVRLIKVLMVMSTSDGNGF